MPYKLKEKYLGQCGQDLINISYNAFHIQRELKDDIKPKIF